MARRFSRFASRVASLAGHWATFVISLMLVLIWAGSGPFFSFSDTWQLVINTAPTISTGLMVFLIQNTQNRDAIAIHLKLDELIRVTSGADDAMMAAEEESQQDLEELRRQYEALLTEHVSLKQHLAKHQR
jgi:low affinity Fe/Cu permease